MVSKTHVAFLVGSVMFASIGYAKGSPEPQHELNESKRIAQARAETRQTIMSLNRSASSELYANLKREFKVVGFSANEGQFEKLTSGAEQQFDILYVDGRLPTVSNKQLNEVLDVALSQGKTILLENTSYFTAETLTALPFLAKGEVVVIKPRSYHDSDRIFVYGARTVDSVKQQYDQLSFTRNKKELKSRSGLLDRRYQSSEIDTLQYDEKQRVFSDVSSKLARDVDNQDLDKMSSNSKSSGSVTIQKTGGAIGYLCPSAARTAKLCWAAIVTNQAYRHVSGEADINILHHYSVAQYRTDQATTIAISTHGSANPNMKVDSDSKKAYYLENVESEIKPTATNTMALWSRTPQNRVNSGSITSTTGMTYGITGSGQDLGGSISYSESQSISMNITDWASNTSSPDGKTAKWIFQLNYPKSISDWVTQSAFQKAKFRSTPGISKYGLQYTTEGIWVGSKDLTGTFSATMTTKVANNQLWFTSNTIFKWAASRNGWVHTLNDGSYSFNNGWLKDL